MSARCGAWRWFGAAAGLYGLSAATGPLWGDPSKLTIYALHHYVPSLNPGDHAGWTALAWVWLRLSWWMEPAASLPWLSVLGGAAAVALVHRLVLARGGEVSQAHAAAAVLLVAHPLWWASAVTESYAPALALALGALAMAGGRRVSLAVMAGLLAGLGAAVHVFSLVLSLPGLLALRTNRLGTVLGFGVGLAPVWLGVFGTPVDPLTGHAAGGAGSWSWHLAAFLHPEALGRGGLLLLAMVLLALGPLGVWGLVRSNSSARSTAPSHRLAWLALGGYALLLCAYAPYRVPLMAGFFVAGLVVLRPPFMGRRGWMVHGVVQAVVLLALPWGLTQIGHGDLGVRRLPGRQNAGYFLSPVKRWEESPARHARALLAAAPSGSVVLADFNPGTVLRLVQEREGLRPDVSIVPTAVDDAWTQADPVAVLGGRIADLRAAGRGVVLADNWPPYYRTADLAARFGIRMRPLASGWEVVAGP